eukprot:scaffold206631_cov28-Tisochrysis_lutea.AAC.1
MPYAGALVTRSVYIPLGVVRKKGRGARVSVRAGCHRTLSSCANDCLIEFTNEVPMTRIKSKSSRHCSRPPPRARSVWHVAYICFSLKASDGQIPCEIVCMKASDKSAFHASHALTRSDICVGGCAPEVFFGGLLDALLLDRLPALFELVAWIKRPGAALTHTTLRSRKRCVSTSVSLLYFRLWRCTWLGVDPTTEIAVCSELCCAVFSCFSTTFTGAMCWLVLPLLIGTAGAMAAG